MYCLRMSYPYQEHTEDSELKPEGVTRVKKEYQGKRKPEKKKSRFKANMDLILGLYLLIRTSKKWWLLPFLFVLAFLALFVSLTGNQSILPAIYALF